MSDIGVFIVDDEDDIRRLMRTLINIANEGLHVVGEAATGTDAIEEFERADPNVIVLDERMPGLTGIETASRMLERRPKLRIVMCSAYLDDELRKRAEGVGIQVCIAKAEVAEIAERLHALAADGS